MKVVFMGTSDFSVPTLEKIISAGHEVKAVVTQPDKKKGRGNNMSYPPVKEKALEHGIMVYQPIKVRDSEFIKILEDIAPDVIVVVAFGQILPKSLLDLPKYGCINVHASLLPKYRGAAPIQWSVIDGEEVTGVTTMYMDAGIDTGDMILKEIIPIEKDETGGSLHDKLSVLGADLLIKTLAQLENGVAVREKQDDEKANYAKMLDKSLGNIDFNKSAQEIERLIRGLNPWPSAYTFLDNKTFKIWEAKVVETKEVSGVNGEVVDITPDTIYVKTSKGLLGITQLQIEGKKRMSAESFLRGYSLKKGTVLGA